MIRDKWIPCKERLPEDDQMCLVTDGLSIALCTSDLRTMPGEVWWDVCGASGYDLEMTFEPTYWMPLTVEMP